MKPLKRNSPTTANLSDGAQKSWTELHVLPRTCRVNYVAFKSKEHTWELGWEKNFLNILINPNLESNILIIIYNKVYLRAKL
jgi:hypothetical protein